MTDVCRRIFCHFAGHPFIRYAAADCVVSSTAATTEVLAPAIVIVNIVDFFLSLAIWGSTASVRVAG